MHRKANAECSRAERARTGNELNPVTSIPSAQAVSRHHIP